MYIKIKDNILTDFANWKFENSQFVDIDYDDFLNNQDRYTLQNGELIDLSQTDNYKTKKRLEKIEEELSEIDDLYYKASQELITFEGHQYKFDWTTLYQGILSSGILPAKIWDATELEENAVVMDEEKLQSLQNYLLVRQENAFQTRKTARSILLSEKENLLKTIKE